MPRPWLPILRGVVVRPGDRVLAISPANAREPIVIGVVDGLARRPPAPAVTAARLELKADETLSVVDPAGTPLFEVSASEKGPVLKLHHQT